MATIVTDRTEPWKELSQRAVAHSPSIAGETRWRARLEWPSLSSNVILEYVPLLQIQRDLYRIERGPERFGAYLRTMIDPAAGAGGVRHGAGRLPGAAAYTRQAVRRYLQHRDRSTVMACLYGDHAARSLEYEPVGLADFAGLALARAAYPAYPA